MTDEELELLRETEEVRIETSRGPDSPSHRTIIWVVVDERGRALIRSYRGEGARWYREARANPECRVHVAGRALELRVEPATDPERVAACSAGLAAKYAGDPATPAMLRDEILGTTLELRAR